MNDSHKSVAYDSGSSNAVERNFANSDDVASDTHDRELVLTTTIRGFTTIMVTICLDLVSRPNLVYALQALSMLVFQNPDRADWARILHRLLDWTAAVSTFVDESNSKWRLRLLSCIGKCILLRSGCPVLLKYVQKDTWFVSQLSGEQFLVSEADIARPMNPSEIVCPPLHPSIPSLICVMASDAEPRVNVLGRDDTASSDRSHQGATQGDSETLSHNDNLSTTTPESHLEMVRKNSYYTQEPDEHGMFLCPWHYICCHKPTRLKCQFYRYVDSHLKPFRCQQSECMRKFSSHNSLLRHERRAHKLNLLYCDVPNCEIFLTALPT
ncbi:hypothetical protein EK21DRAFT_95151 [Setomelanomma holmii]|uniref:C2H2-type domain-containing protein n=1 Tax=Setomelanomma holmii TaxID=210430 RepID=A0A9P4LFF1_9PLEO|nr:hypothetical protein EK21DRAFT_95151 [Setomelanomma holmii]